MDKIRKYRFGGLVDFAMDDFAHYFGDPIATSYSYKGRWVDEDKFDIVPKRSWYDSQIKGIEEDMATLDRQRESTQKYYENQKKVLQEKKEKLEREKQGSG